MGSVYIQLLIPVAEFYATCHKSQTIKNNWTLIVTDSYHACDKWKRDPIILIAGDIFLMPKWITVSKSATILIGIKQ